MRGFAWKYVEIIFVATIITIINILNQKNAERSGSVGRVLNWGLKDIYQNLSRNKEIIALERATNTLTEAVIQSHVMMLID